MNLVKILENNLAQQAGVYRPYMIAEAGVNHEGSMDLAKRLIDEAKEGGADAIKFQTYKAGKIASKHSPAYWDLEKEPTESQYKLFQKYDKFWKSEFTELKKYCDQVGIEFLSTPFDVESAAFLNDLMCVFKISSSDLNNKPFIKELCGYNKPIILSTGASYLWEVEQAISWIESEGNPCALLHCVLNYPTKDNNANLGSITTLKEKFQNHVIGYSDHTLPKDMKTLEVATLLGAQIIEKHFTHDKSLAGNDHYHAMDKEDLKVFYKRIDKLNELVGSSLKEPLESEVISRKNARRSLVAAREIKRGVVISKDDLTWKRPAYGIDPRNIEDLLGKRSRIEIEKDTVLEWGLFE